MSGRSAMLFREVRIEAGRNIATGTTKAVWFALILAMTSGALCWLDTTNATAVLNRAREFQARSASISIITVEGGIDGRVCDSLAEQPGVRAAGALRKESVGLVLAQLPQNPVTWLSSSPGFAAMLPGATGQREPGLLLSEQVAETLHAAVGSSIRTTSGDTRVGGTYRYPDDGRPPGLGYAVIAPTASDKPFDECWIDLFPADQATIDLLYTAVSAEGPSNDSTPAVTQHNPSLGAAVDPAIAYRQRITAPAPLAGLAIAIVIGSVAVWLRRLELASALHSGVRKRDQLAAMAIETMSWAMLGAAASVPLALLITRELLPADRAAVLLSGLMIPATSVAGVLIGAIGTTLLVREKRLLDYFKTR